MRGGTKLEVKSPVGGLLDYSRWEMGKAWITKVTMGTICNSQDRETTYMSINRGMDKEDVVHTMEHHLP